MEPQTVDVSVGDSFTKVGALPRTIYVVASIVDTHGTLPHARLEAEDHRSGMLMSPSVLLDPRFWSRVGQSENEARTAASVSAGRSLRDALRRLEDTGAAITQQIRPLIEQVIRRGNSIH
jgi:hypothetical protein